MALPAGQPPCKHIEAVRIPRKITGSNKYTMVKIHPPKVYHHMPGDTRVLRNSITVPTGILCTMESNSRVANSQQQQHQRATSADFGPVC
jgi:hypothetical protein